MAEGMNLPSMFDTQYAMGRQMEDDAMAAGKLPLGGGMMYASSMKGDIRNQGLMSLAGLMGGKGDPRMEKQKIIKHLHHYWFVHFSNSSNVYFSFFPI